MKKDFFILLIPLFLSAAFLHSQPNVIAHRGYWKTERSAQNSMASLMKADSINVYGSEVDIWLSSDGVPIVNHDAAATLNGQKVIVQDTPATLLQQVTLANGEPMPTLEAYLNAFERCKNIQLIIELKPHKTKAQEDELAKKTIEMVHRRNLQNRVEYISFGINFLTQIKQLDPQAKTYYLNGDLSPESLSAIGAAGIDYHLSVLQKRPHWVKSAHDSGQKVNVWTVNKPDDIREMIRLNVDFITTDEPLLVKEILKKQ